MQPLTSQLMGVRFSDLDEAKSRALDNTGRVYARTGEFAKAIAV